MAKPIIAIVGRQNVGKSTLLNRLAGKRLSIVEDLPGTTRDRLMVDIEYQGRPFTLIDTGGVNLAPATSIALAVNQQIEIAIKEADFIILVTDAQAGLLPDDMEVANRLRQSNKPVLLVVNKVDSERLETTVAEFYRLGLGEPFPISAYHARNTLDLLDKLITLLPVAAPETATAAAIKVAIVGRPNVGKSTLLNALVGEERSIVDETPGTTRDTVDTLIDYRGQLVLLIDTAGIKRRGKIERGVEQYSVIRSEEAIERAEIALLVLDASTGVAAQDTHVAGYIQKAAKGMIIVVNKWDLTSVENRAEYNKYIAEQFRFMAYAPVLYISAKTGQGVDQIIPYVLAVYQERMKRLPTSLVNSVVQAAVAAHTLPHKAGRRLKVLYATQAEVNPPTFVFSVNDGGLAHFSYRRYLENQLRQSFGFSGTPIRLVFKSRGAS